MGNIDWCGIMMFMVDLICCVLFCWGVGVGVGVVGVWVFGVLVDLFEL